MQASLMGVLGRMGAHIKQQPVPTNPYERYQETGDFAADIVGRASARRAARAKGEEALWEQAQCMGSPNEEEEEEEAGWSGGWPDELRAFCAESVLRAQQLDDY